MTVNIEQLLIAGAAGLIGLTLGVLSYYTQEQRRRVLYSLSGFLTVLMFVGIVKVSDVVLPHSFQLGVPVYMATWAVGYFAGHRFVRPPAVDAATQDPLPKA